MRKISVILIALTLIQGCASCGSNSSATSDTSSQILTSPTEESVETTTEDEVVEVDPFENVTFSTTSSESYPIGMTIKIDSSQSDADSIYKNRGYTLNITEAGIDTIKFNISIDEDVVEGLEEENNIIISPTEKDFELPIKDCSMKLISEKQLTDENKNALIELIRNQILEDIASDNSYYKADIKDDLTFVSCYMSDVKPDADFIKDYNYSCSDGQIHTNGDFDDFGFIAIFKNSDDQYFTGNCIPEFYNGQLSDEDLYASVCNCTDNTPLTAEYKCYPSVERIILGYTEKDLLRPLDFALREIK